MEKFRLCRQNVDLPSIADIYSSLMVDSFINHGEMPPCLGTYGSGYIEGTVVGVNIRPLLKDDVKLKLSKNCTFRGTKTDLSIVLHIKLEDDCILEAKDQQLNLFWWIDSYYEREDGYAPIVISDRTYGQLIKGFKMKKAAGGKRGHSIHNDIPSIFAALEVNELVELFGKKVMIIPIIDSDELIHPKNFDQISSILIRSAGNQINADTMLLTYTSSNDPWALPTGFSEGK